MSAVVLDGQPPPAIPKVRRWGHPTILAERELKLRLRESGV
ncbi:hypothetical protein [Arthrobacter sp. NPDC058192]